MKRTPPLLKTARFGTLLAFCMLGLGFAAFAVTGFPTWFGYALAMFLGAILTNAACDEIYIRLLERAFNGWEESRDAFCKSAAAIVEPLEALIEEYEDRKAQFGSDYLWQKHEMPGVLEDAKAVVAGLAAWKKGTQQ